MAWIGGIPQQWSGGRGKEMLIERNERSKHGSEELLSVSTYTGIKPRREMIDADDSLSRAESLVDYKICHSGDIVINTMLAWNGSIGLSNYAGIVSPAYAVYKLRKGFYPKFVEYLLRSESTLIKICAESRGINDARLRLYPDSLFAIQFGTPSFPEQRAIADYLDHQTALIDQRLSTLEEKKSVLAELRKATIHEAVTKGLNNHAKMKDSGVAWIGEIPQDWKVEPFKSVIAFREGPGIMAADFKDAGVPLLRIGNITQGLISLEGCNYLDPAKVSLQWNQFRVRQGDLIISASASVGIVSEVGEDAVGSIPYTGLITLRPSRRVLNNFLRYFVVSELFVDQILNFQKGATIQHYGPTHLKQMLIPLPPVEAQATIANHLDQQTQLIDAQLATLDEQAQVLKELRKAIIHEAVTGKIDVGRDSSRRVK